MMKEYFEIEESKVTPKYRFRKGLKLFDDKGYQAAKNELKVNLLGRRCIDMLSSENLTWDIRKQALWYFMFLKNKRSGKMKARGCANGHLNKNLLLKNNQVHQLCHYMPLWVCV